MCRWMAYLGDPILADDLLFRPEHSIIDQSLHARLGGVTTNGTASASGGTPTVGKQRLPFSREPTRPGTTEICARSPRRSTRRCCSPTSGPRAEHRCSAATATRSDMAGGCGCTTDRSPGSTRSKRDLLMAVDESLYPEIEGSTDTETFSSWPSPSAWPTTHPPRSPAPSAWPNRWADGTAWTTRCT